MFNRVNNISSSAVKKATGKNWTEWVKFLDGMRANTLTHKQIAQALGSHIKNGWWCQMVTVGYEYIKGRRVVGKTVSAGFEIGVQKVVKVAPARVWNFMMSAQGLSLWLGGVDNLKLVKGYKFRTKQGVTGEVRTFDKGKKLRLFWTPQKGSGKSTTLQFYLMPSGRYLAKKTTVPSGKLTAIRFHHERLSSSSERTKMRKHWQTVLDALAKNLR